ncbi:hypothetical protein Vretimale_11751, partial [Volvox reticuliferus]
LLIMVGSGGGGTKRSPQRKYLNTCRHRLQCTVPYDVRYPREMALLITSAVVTAPALDSSNDDLNQPSREPVSRKARPFPSLSYLPYKLGVLGIFRGTRREEVAVVTLDHKQADGLRLINGGHVVMRKRERERP